MEFFHLFVSIVAFHLVTSASGQLTTEEIQVFTDNGVSVSDHSEDYWLFEHSGVPSHETGDFPNRDNPNEITEQNHDYLIPKVPDYLSNPECLELGAIGAAVNGIPYFNPYTIEGYNAVEGDYAEVFDDCDGHPDGTGTYHYHQLPDCVYDGLAMQLLGVALDGYAIYGPLDADGIEIAESDLDECHGRTYDGRYMYHATREFPYILGCHRGTSTANTPPNNDLDWESCIASCENPALGCDSGDTVHVAHYIAMICLAYAVIIFTRQGFDT